MKTKILKILRIIGEFAAVMVVIAIAIKIGQFIDPAFAADQSALPISDEAKEVYKSGSIPVPPEKEGQAPVIEKGVINPSAKKVMIYLTKNKVLRGN